ncbi:MAG: flagellar basal body P-ring protein FlgI [Candidatus Acidiferrales bacterium]|jgi:flagellar P-ring protein precursor FlgI
MRSARVTFNFVALLVFTLLGAATTCADEPKHAIRQVRLRDISTVEGVRDNMLIGYGLVVGLKKTGDSQQTQFSTQTLANILARMGLQIPVSSVQVRNVAAVFVTATLPPFARPGTRIDVTVSSIGDAKSLEGGLLLLTPLRASDGQDYAAAQGPLVLAGYTAGAHGNTTTVNQPTVGRVPNGGIVERDASVDLSHLTHVSMLLRDPDFGVARDAAAAINKEFGRGVARALDGSRIEVNASGLMPDGISVFLAKVGEVQVAVPTTAKVVVNERTGTVVMGSDVSLGACSILQGSLAVNIFTTYEVSQPKPFSPNGTTVVVPETTVTAKESPAQAVRLKEGATVEDLVRGLQAIGATARDIIAILQAIKAAGALQAELEVI